MKLIHELDKMFIPSFDSLQDDGLERWMRAMTMDLLFPRILMWKIIFFR